MKTQSIVPLSLCGFASIVLGYQVNQNKGVFSRRNLLATGVAALVAAPLSVQAADEDPLVPVYFGVGVSHLLSD
jgi:hypothetical protein